MQAFQTTAAGMHHPGDSYIVHVRAAFGIPSLYLITAMSMLQQEATICDHYWPALCRQAPCASSTVRRVQAARERQVEPRGAQLLWRQCGHLVIA